MYGFFGKMLRIDLSSCTSTIEEIPEKILKSYLGGKGIGTYLLLNEVDNKTDPLSPENKIIFVTGPASDSGHPAASRYGVISKSPLTEIYAESYAGGHVAPVMKKTGFDAIIVQGASDKPVFLHVNDGEVIFYDASFAWGMESYQAENELKKKTGTKGSQALVIGPAGENLVRFACIKNNFWRSAGRAGLGAVMGSKKLKGMVFSGNNNVELADKDKLRKHIVNLRERCKEDAGARNYHTFGTPMLVSVLNEAKSFPTRYWHQGSFDSSGKINAEYMQDNMKVKSRACRGCFFACGKLTEVTKGRHKGTVIEGPEYETIYAFGGLCYIDSMEEIVYLNDICDRLGIDTISAGNLAAFTVEAGLMGKINNASAYGDVDGIAKLLKDISRKEGLGEILAEGIKNAASEWEMEDVAIHVKGMEPAGYDPRVLKGMGLGYATSSRGACHLRATFYKAELSGIIDPQQIEGKAELFVDYEDRLTIFDTLILCRFYRDLLGWEELREIIHSLTGIDYEVKELRKIANDIVTMTRIFNVSCGVSKKDDILPPRFHQEVLENEKYLITKGELEQMLSDYYKIRRWDVNGIPEDAAR